MTGYFNIIQFSDLDMPQRRDLEFLTEKALETSGNFSWVPSAFAGTLAKLVLKKSNPFNPGMSSLLQSVEISSENAN